MTKAQYEKRLAELEAEADKRGCCVIPARPLREPAARAPRQRKHQAPATKSRRK